MAEFVTKTDEFGREIAVPVGEAASAVPSVVPESVAPGPVEAEYEPTPEGVGYAPDEPEPEFLPPTHNRIRTAVKTAPQARTRHVPGHLSAQQLVMAQLRKSPEKVETVEDLYKVADMTKGQGATERGTVTHYSSPMVVMYKPDGFSGHVRRVVPATNALMNWEGGWLTECPDCGSDCGTDPNACPAHEPKKYRRCPVCAKKIYDTVDRSFGEEDGDENLIDDGELGESTPAERTLAAMQMHCWVRHPDESRMRHIPIPAGFNPNATR